MASRNVNYWTLSSIIMAFVDLAVVYTLLCGSASAFICTSLLSFFGINMPCPCSGFFGYQSYDFCWHKLLIDWPRRKIIAVEELINSRFPFDSVNLDVEGHRNRKFENGVSEFEGEACSTSLSGPTPCESIDRESDCKSNGKKVMNQKTKSGIRRRKRAALGYGKILPPLSSNYSDSVGVGVLHPFYDFSGSIRTSSESLDAEAAKEDDCPGNDANVIRALERALEEEKAARTMLYHELEKERAAAASAADEAMAMILRLQEDKASIEMEARQYHRVIEEKCNYDEEEMKILKEILVRRETEIHFLEKQVEAYEEMNIFDNHQVEGDKNKEWTPSHSIYSNVNQEGCDMESTVYDVHVIDDKTVLSEGDHGKEKEAIGTPGLDLEQHFSTTVDGERLKIDNEVEWLRERLRAVQEEKEKLTFSAEHSERVNAELKLVKDMVSQLQKTHVLNKRLRLDSNF